MLDAEVRAELRSLSKETADVVARHLVMTGRLLDDDPTGALAHARAARALAGRVGAVREACGLAAYAGGEWTEALAELRAARRITGQTAHLAVMADSERALDRPERALAYGNDPDVRRLGQAERVELVIVLAGARRDMGQPDAAVLQLQDPARRTSSGRPWAARLWYALADALLAAGRESEAREWFARAAQTDVDAETDATERLLELDGVVFEDLDELGDLDASAETGEEPESTSLDDLVDEHADAGQRATLDPSRQPVEAVQADADAADRDAVDASRPPDVDPAADPRRPGVATSPFSGPAEDAAGWDTASAGDSVPTVPFRAATDGGDEQPPAG